MGQLLGSGLFTTGVPNNPQVHRRVNVGSGGIKLKLETKYPTGTHLV